MLTVATHGPDQPNLATLPFAALKGAVESGEFTDHPPTVFLMQEATYLAHRDVDLSEVKAVGLPPVQEIVEFLLEHGFRMVVCAPCAGPRGVAEEDLADYASMGSSTDLARLIKEHHFVLTF